MVAGPPSCATSTYPSLVERELDSAARVARLGHLDAQRAVGGGERSVVGERDHLPARERVLDADRVRQAGQDQTRAGPDMDRARPAHGVEAPNGHGV
jgi:hypothetical protein